MLMVLVQLYIERRKKERIYYSESISDSRGPRPPRITQTLNSPRREILKLASSVIIVQDNKERFWCAVRIRITYLSFQVIPNSPSR